MASSLYLLQAGCFRTHGGTRRQPPRSGNSPLAAINHVQTGQRPAKRSLHPVEGVGTVVISTFVLRQDPK